ncbi:MAG TPA: glutamate racemase [Chitinophagaceae bacterium]|nr:glutamate racemase [Chitinophagaceae bacterium]
MAPIGVFDSGYGGLTILKDFIKLLPEYDYLYLGDNSRAPYGPRSFETVYKYTLECVTWLLSQNCPLIILACNTASAKALRTIQQNDLARLDEQARVLGVIRPTSEIIGDYTHSKNIGILATKGTVQSNSYALEIQKFFPGVNITQEACPMWVPLIENQEYDNEGADYFIKKNLSNIFKVNPGIDALLLACTHYPLIAKKIRDHLPTGVQLISQGEIVAASLQDYLARHTEIDDKLSKSKQRVFYTTDSTEEFDLNAAHFYGEVTHSKHVDL